MNTPELRRRGLGGAQGALWGILLSIALVLLCCLLTAILSALLRPGRAAASPTHDARVVIVRQSPDSQLPTEASTYLVEGGPLPTIRRGRRTFLACADSACQRYVVTVAGWCRAWSVGAVVVEDRPCLYLPGVRR